MKLTLLAVLMGIMISGNNPNVEFSEQNTTDWQVIVDGVMGGRSTGQLKLTGHSIVFNGVVSLENNGGFSSLKGPFERMDLSGFSEVEISYRSTGISTAFTIETSDLWYEPSYKSPLPNTEKDWKKQRIDLRSMGQYVIGRNTGKVLDDQELKRALRIGFITNEKKAGEFELEVEYIRFIQ